MQAIQYLEGKEEFADRIRFPMPDIVLLDLKMPEATGLDVLRWMKEHPNFRVIPTVVMSASQYEQDVAQAYELGANTYFRKPSSFDTLVDMCRCIGMYWSYSIKPIVRG